MALDTVSLRNMFEIPVGYGGHTEELYYSIMRDNSAELTKVGHHLWMFPINKIANLIEALDPLEPLYNKESINSIFLYTLNIPAFKADNIPKSLKAWKAYFDVSIDSYINSSQDVLDEFTHGIGLTLDDLRIMKSVALYFLYSMMIHLRNVLAHMIIADMEHIQPQIIPVHSHPAWKLYKVEDIVAGHSTTIGDGADTVYGKSLISSNDISGLLVKLKTVYMRAAYLQLIQTLSQLAEKKSYKIITFRQDELSGVLKEIEKLSSETYRQLKLEDELISKICYNIIKVIDPDVDMAKTMAALALDIGDYPASAYALQRRVIE